MKLEKRIRNMKAKAYSDMVMRNRLVKKAKRVAVVVLLCASALAFIKQGNTQAKQPETRQDSGIYIYPYFHSDDGNVYHIEKKGIADGTRMSVVFSTNGTETFTDDEPVKVNY